MSETTNAAADKSMSFEEMLETTGKVAYTNVGVSMMPLIRQGRDVMVIRRKEGPCHKYDAVLFKRPGKTGRGAYVLHRVLRVNGDGTYWIVGDNCISGETVRDENVLGVLESVIRDGKPLDLDSPSYHAYVRLWCAPWPVRMGLLRAKSLAGRAVRKVLPKK